MTLEQAEKAYAKAHSAFEVASIEWLNATDDDEVARDVVLNASRNLTTAGIDLAWARAERAVAR